MSFTDEIVSAYDKSINWGDRLSREIPFLLDSLSTTKPNQVLDIACGSGRHSVALASHGADVVGFDKSPHMIQAANAIAKKEGVAPRFIIADMIDFQKTIVGKFDLIICLGNSLALLEDLDTVSRVLSSVFSKMSSESAFVCQVLNFDEIRKSGFRYFPFKRSSTHSGEEVVFARFFDHDDAQSSTLLLSAFIKKTKGWTSTVSTQKVLHLNQSNLDKALRTAGFTRIEMFSDYEGKSFVTMRDRNLVIRAR